MMLASTSLPAVQPPSCVRVGQRRVCRRPTALRTSRWQKATVAESTNPHASGRSETNSANEDVASTSGRPPVDGHKQQSPAWQIGSGFGRKFARRAARLGVIAGVSSNSGIGGIGGWSGGNGWGGHGGNGWGWGQGGMPGSGHGGAAANNVLGDLALSDATELVEEVVLLDVGGMKCGGCVGHVKKILEAQENVVEASVNLATETALVKVMVPKGAAGQAALRKMGETLAQVVAKEGFTVLVRQLGGKAPSAAMTTASK